MTALRKSEDVEDFCEKELKQQLEDVLESLKAESSGRPVGENKDAAPQEDEEPHVLTPAEVMKKLQDKVAEVANEIDDKDNKLAKWVKYAETLVRERVSLVAEASSETALIKQLQTIPAMTLTPAGKGQHVVIIYDVKQAGESMSRPRDRPPATRKAHLRKLLGVVLQVRGGRKAIQPTDVNTSVRLCKVHGLRASIGVLACMPGTCVSACGRACVRACARACVRAGGCPSVRACVQTCMRACVRACLRVRVCVPALLRKVRGSMCACLLECLRACTPACAPTRVCWQLRFF